MHAMGSMYGAASSSSGGGGPGDGDDPEGFKKAMEQAANKGKVMNLSPQDLCFSEDEEDGDGPGWYQRQDGKIVYTRFPGDWTDTGRSGVGVYIYICIYPLPLPTPI